MTAPAVLRRRGPGGLLLRSPGNDRVRRELRRREGRRRALSGTRGDLHTQPSPTHPAAWRTCLCPQRRLFLHSSSEVTSEA